MSRRFLPFAVLALLVLSALLAPPALAQDRPHLGLRLGLADDPDQVIGGVQFDLGRFYDDFRFVPTVDLGLGDDTTMFLATAPVHFVIPNASQVTPYFGIGLVVGWIDYDNDSRRGDDSDVEIGGKLTAGIEGDIGANRRLFLELNLLTSDFHDAQIVGGFSWAFR